LALSSPAGRRKQPLYPSPRLRGEDARRAGEGSERSELLLLLAKSGPSSAFGTFSPLAGRRRKKNPSPLAGRR
jgi:hypothetical protein